jgi:hypothetical protein
VTNKSFPHAIAYGSFIEVANRSAVQCFLLFSANLAPFSGFIFVSINFVAAHFSIIILSHAQKE